MCLKAPQYVEGTNMQTQDAYYASLQAAVEKARSELEKALWALSNYEEFHNIKASSALTVPAPTLTVTRTEAPPPKVEVVPPPPPPVQTQTIPAPVATAAPATPERGLNKDGSPRKKPGPPKGFNVHAKNRKKASAKAAQPAKTKKPIKAKANGTKKQEQRSKPGPKPGAKRRDVPALVDAIQQVMGNKTMNADMVYDALEQRGWLPVSNDPKGYVRYTLSKNKEIFLRVDGKRGFYHLDLARPNGRARKSEESLTPTAEPEKKDVDRMLEATGIDLKGSNPFAQPSTG